MRRSGLRPISKKRAAQMPEYEVLVKKLRKLCNNRSELSGDRADWQGGGLVDPHHIDGREGDLLVNAFGIIMLTRTEHDIEGGQIPGDKHSKEELYAIVKPLRLAAGYKEEDYA